MVKLKNSISIRAKGGTFKKIRNSDKRVRGEEKYFINLGKKYTFACQRIIGIKNVIKL